MNRLERLIGEISDENLREQIKTEIDNLTKTFGLVFESKDEFFPRNDLPVKKNSLVAKIGKLDETFIVTDIDGDKIFCSRDEKTFEFTRDEIICVNRLGSPIYPGLTKLDEICNAPNSELWHLLIEAENYHALQLLKYPFAGKVDCIYIDPPYNTGARDWKYNDAFVDAADRYNHSKWLAMMERRLLLAKELLSDSGAIFISIDDNEQATLKLLCDKIFSAKNFVAQLICKAKLGKVGTTSLISSEHEYITCYAKNLSNVKFNMIVKKNEGRKENLRQWGQADRRADRPTMFYPINIDGQEVYPIKDDGTEGRWRVSKERAHKLLQNGELELKIKNGVPNIYRNFAAGETFMPYGSWLPENISATAKGTVAVKNLGLNFAYPKPIELLAFILRLATNKPDALILDFFAGSGTTLHAVNLLNAEDGGNRRCILVTNNENDIARSVTWQRTICSIKGRDINGTPLNGNYLGTNLAMSDGFKSNAVFFALNCLDKNSVELGKQFNQTLPVLWLKAGGVGRCPIFDEETLPPYKIFAENKFAVLFNETYFAEFKTKLDGAGIETLFAVTGSEASLNLMAQKLRVAKSFRLYEDYLENFKLEEVTR